MNAVYLAGCGLACALGVDLAGSLATLRGGHPVAPGSVGDERWPYYAIADDAPQWMTRARRIIERVAHESGALAGARRGPLFVASSSFDIGMAENGEHRPEDFHRFSEAIADWLHWQGPVFTVSTACTSSLTALLSARASIRHRDAQQALVLGVELRNRVTLAGFAGLGLLSPERALPLGAQRTGLILGEAVAALHLSSQRARWRIAGGANVVDGHDATGTTFGETMVAACRAALTDSLLAPREIGLIKLQATGSPGSDAAELCALQQMFSPLPALVSLKGTIGHTLGAAGAAEVALLTGCIEARVWPKANHARDGELPAPPTDCLPPHAPYLLACIGGFGGGQAAVSVEDCAA